MNYIKKTAIFCLIAGLTIGTAQANMSDEIEGWLKSHNWHRMTIWGTKIRTQDLLLDGPLSILAIGLGFSYFHAAFTRDFSVPKIHKGLRSSPEAVCIGFISLAFGAAGLGAIYHNTKAIQAENQ